MKKYTSLISLISGLTGLIAIGYFNYQLGKNYEELNGIHALVTLFHYGQTSKIVLYILTAIGLITGLISVIKVRSQFWRIIGIVGRMICIFNMIILLLTPL